MNRLPGHAARKYAWQILNDLDDTGLTLDRIMDRHLADRAGLSQKDRALVNALVFGVLRWRYRLDWTLSQFSKTRLAKISPPLLNLLRLALYQVLFMDRIPPSAAVNTAVELTKEAHPPWVVKFTNAVLRAAIRGHQGLSLPSAKIDPITALCVEKSFAPWMIRRWIKAFGYKETAALCDAVNTIPPITLRVNTLKADRESLYEKTSPRAESAALTRFSPDGIRLFATDRPVFEMDGFATGQFGVQDEAAQLVSYLVRPVPGLRVLDACAGLGGKTGHLAQLMADQGELVAVDRSAEKTGRLEQEMARLGATCVTTTVHDFKETADFQPFDRVLLDAPCSGLGVLRRNPDGKWNRRPEDVFRCAKGQKRLLHTLAPLVSPGGLLVYSVCSTEPEENQGVIQDFLARHPEFALAPVSEGLPEPAHGLMTPDGFLRTLPHRHEMDGFFAAVLKRNG